MKQITIDNAIARFALEERDAARERLDRLWQDPFLGDAADPRDDEGDDESGEFDAVDDEPANEAPPETPRFRAATGDARGEALQARAALDKAARLRPKATAEDQAELDRLTEVIRSAMAALDWPGVGKATAELTDVMFYLEDA